MFSKKKKLLNKIRSEWGMEINRKRDFNLISLFFRLNDNTDYELVDDTTWSDLNMDDFFSKIDRTNTPIGSQYLYQRMRTYEPDIGTLNKQYELYRFLSNNDKIREEIQLILSKLDTRNSFYLPNLLFKEQPVRPRWYFIFYVLSFASIVSMVLIYFYPFFFLIALSIILINLVVEHLYGKNAIGYSIDISALSILLRVGIQLSEIKKSEKIKQLENLKGYRTFSKSLLKKIWWLTVDKTRLNELSAALIEYLNHFCLFNLVAYVRSIHLIKNHQPEIQRIFELVASLDSAISIASYLSENKKHCVPSFNKTNTINFDEVYHPLLDKPVPNSIALDGKSCLVTGSNMAGKTTFIKTVAINFLLAQTLNFTLAKKANIPRLFVKTSIKRTDDITEHKSYYFREIEALLEFIKLNKYQGQYIFIIDEIFRGTNTVERISAATSVLKYLAVQNYTFVTTHDIELQDLLTENFEMYHFSEQVSDGRFYFDYRINPGPCSSRNAIKLLELKGYPDNIIKEANELALKVSSQVDEVREKLV